MRGRLKLGIDYTTCIIKIEIDICYSILILILVALLTFFVIIFVIIVYDGFQTHRYVHIYSNK